MKYDVKNLHSVPRTYRNSNGQLVEFAAGEKKYDLKSKPPASQELWQVETVEQSVKPEDTELKGGDN